MTESTLRISNELRRYTDVTSLLDILTNTQIVLLDPHLWDDRNDSACLAEFAKRSQYTAVHALCMTGTAETYHHWRVFADRPSGVCLVFNRQRLLRHVRKYSDTFAKSVAYKTEKGLREAPLAVIELPFVKRKAFKDEREVRIVRGSRWELKAPTAELPIELDLIDRVVVNPWMPRSLYLTLRTIIRRIDGCEHLSVRRSLLTDNERWQNQAFGGA